MAYRFKANESVAEGAKRIVLEQIDDAIGELTDKALDRHEGVHQARKRFKKIRAVVRLVRSELGEVYSQENAWFRDAGRRLSEVRDAEAIIESLDKLMAAYPEQTRGNGVKTIRKTLVARRQQIADQEVDLDKRARQMATDLKKVKKRIKAWPLEGDGFALLAPNLAKTYRRGRRAMTNAYLEPTPENFHEWRKRVKYHWYHSRLLENIWPKVMQGYKGVLKDLADFLGDDHDLVVLRETLLGESDRFGGKPGVEELLLLIERRQGEFRRQAETVGQRVFLEKPKRFGGRLGSYWATWQTELERSSN